MAQISGFELLHPVRHNGHLHPAGVALKLTSSEGSRLVRLGVARPKDGAAVIEVVDDIAVDNSAAIATLAEKSKAELIEFAKSSLGLTLAPTLKKDEILAAILNAHVASGVAVTLPGAVLNS